MIDIESVDRLKENEKKLEQHREKCVNSFLCENSWPFGAPTKRWQSTRRPIVLDDWRCSVAKCLHSNGEPNNKRITIANKQPFKTKIVLTIMKWRRRQCRWHCLSCVHLVTQTFYKWCHNSAGEWSMQIAELIFKIAYSFCFFLFFRRNFVDYGLLSTYYSAGCVYIVFIATTIRDVANYEFNVDYDVRLYIALTIIPCIFLGQIRQLKYLVPFSAMANLFIVVTFGITLYYMFTGPLEYSERPLFSSWAQLPLFFR